MRKIGINEIDGFRLGNAENSEKGTGCTVIICEEGAVGGVDVRGGGPATRETDLLRSENTVSAVNAVVLSGGSAFGLEAASGVMRELSDRGVGFDVGGITVPIVCGASLFDLAVGDPKAFPDVGMGIEATRNAYADAFVHGNHGAGTGATVGKYLGHDRAMKSGLGTFACGDDFVKVGAVVAVNAIGDVYNGPGNIIAGLRSEDGESIYGTIKTLKGMVHENAGLVDDSTTFISREEIEKALRGAEEPSAPVAEPEVKEEVLEPAAEQPAEAVEEIVPTAEEVVTEPEEPVAVDTDEAEAEVQEAPAAEEEPAAPVAESEPEEKAPELTREEMGYNVVFNTTIGCLIT
ncbi:MAG: P1 family peptidase, partial [Mogibacterium sp.]|nr:P1 family peptidase [Mogibacterium sp.]